MNSKNFNIGGFLISLLSSLFDEHWYLFLIYLSLNVIDCFTGTIKARVFKQENSKTAFKGLLKKISCWILLLVSFLLSVVFIQIGDIINTDFSVVIYLGWFVLGSLVINECRSILENLVATGCPIPYVLIKGLDITNKVIDNKHES